MSSEILKILDSLKLVDNTLAIFSSDNGPVLDDKEIINHTFLAEVGFISDRISLAIQREILKYWRAQQPN